jgi:beta-glucosidase
MTIEEQAAEIVAKMTLKERASLLYGNKTWHTYAIPKYGVKSVTMSDGPLGLRKALDQGKIDDANSPAAPATCFPAPCLTACSWDPEVFRSLGQMMAYECINQGVDVLLAPGVNIKRNPLCGRNFEYLSEDPLLAGKMAASFINAMQGQGVGVSLKHFAMNNQETHRFTYNSECDIRAMREIYLKPFEIAVKTAQPWTVMCSYNKIKGVYSSDNRWLLTDVLRGEWGYKGIVVSDWGATNNPVYSHASGLDLEMPCYDKHASYIVSAIKANKLSAKEITDEALRIIELSLKCQHKIPAEKALNDGMAHEAAKMAAEKSIVLLKNEGGFLPLKDLSGCCVIGALAKKPRYQGAGSSQVTPKHLVSFFDAINVGRENDELPYAPGYSLEAGKGDPKKLSFEALDLAHSSKAVILFLGLPDSYEAEGYDRSNMQLPPEQIDLFKSLYDANPNIVVVLSLGAPVELPFVNEAKSIVLGYLGGEAGGEALADVITGKINPSGKLAETWPYHYNDVPSKMFYPLDGYNNSLYKESVFVGYRYYLTANRETMFPFGHGLSYTEYDYSDLKVSSDSIGPKGSLDVSLKVTNKGTMDGEEVVELYLAPMDNKVLKPVRELRAFSKVFVPAGKTAMVRMNLSYDDFCHYEAASERWEAEPGLYEVQVGASSENIILRASVNVKSSFVSIDKRALLPTYYHLPNRGTLWIEDEEFERLLGHPVPAIRHKKNKATLQTPLRDIADTFIGKKIVKVARSKADQLYQTEEEKDRFLDMIMDAPIRMATTGGISIKKGQALVDLVNHRPIKAFFDVQFWHYK